MSKINERLLGLISATLILIGVANILNAPPNGALPSTITIPQIIGIITVLANIIIGLVLLMVDEK